jgi:hypothetical protein
MSGQGAHMREIAARLGHSNPMVTMRTYAHILPSLNERLVASNMTSPLPSRLAQGQSSALMARRSSMAW